MDEFVAEIRPIVYTPLPFIPTDTSGDFVAELRPRAGLPQSGMRYRSSQCQDDGVSDQELQNILSGEHFSREDIIRILRGSILKLVEKLLTGRPLSQVEGHMCVSLSNNASPITVAFSQTYPSNNGAVRYSPIEQTLKDSFNVKVKNGDMGMFAVDGDGCGATSPLFEFEREQCNSVVEADDSLYFEQQRDMDSLSCSPRHGIRLNTPALFAREGESAARLQAQIPVNGSQFQSNRRHDSDDDESGYTSNEKDDSDTSCEHPLGDNRCPMKLYNPFNDYYCSGFDGENTTYAPLNSLTAVCKSNCDTKHFTCARKESTSERNDEDFEFQNRLVIDESPSQEMRGRFGNDCCGSEMNLCNDRGQSMDVDGEDVIEVCELNSRDAVGHSPTEAARNCLNGSTNEADFHDSSDITDTDVPVDFSGDSNITPDAVSGFPQSAVFKHPDGFRCKECCYIMENIPAVADHMQTHHNLYCCTVCCRTFTAKNNLKRHLRIHTGQRPYKCAQCPQSFARRDDLKDHTLRHDYNNPFRCSACKRGYTDRASVKNHMAKEHGSRLMHVCPQCGESHDDEESFAAHKKTHPELQQFSCGKCSFIGTNSQMTQKHTLVHTYKLFSCSPCGAHFADPFDYTNHIRKHKKASSFSQYLCCFCDLALSTYDQFVRHEYSHAQTKTHGCKACKKVFRTKSLLQDHATTHQDLQKSEMIQPCVNLPLEVSALSEQLPEAGPHNRSEELSTESIESRAMLWQSTEKQDNNLCSPITELRYSLASTHILPSPKTCSSPSQLKEEEEFQGELLDLSMKKKSPVLSPNHPRNCDANFEPCPRETRIAETNFRRNDVVRSHSCLLGHGHEDNERTFGEGQRRNSGGHHEGRIYSRADTLCGSSINSEWGNNGSPEGTASPRSLRTSSSGSDSCPYINPMLLTSRHSDEFTRNTEDHSADKQRLLASTKPQKCVQRSSFRFSPYSRDKIADLAAKFMAARGTEIFQQPAFLKTVAPVVKNTTEVAAANREFGQMSETFNRTELRRKMSSTFKSLNEFTPGPEFLRARPTMNVNVASLREGNIGHEILREKSNPETALRSLATTLVKAEPILEGELDTKDAADGSAQSLKEDCRMHAATPCLCEDCKEVFGSFAELESHSVEMHKRFLCEHCKKSFTARPNRDRHVRYHTGERPYKCDLCDLAFFRGDDLKYHRTTRHPSAQPFICSRCDASFAWRRDLDRHIRHSKCKS